MIRNLFFISGLLLFFFSQAVSQNGFNFQSTYIPPSPNASSLLEYASIPVNLHSGIPEISVPLYNLKGRKISVPISLSYHASGNKVQDISSSVGLGWTLNAGGVVTRIIRGIPDEDATKGYLALDFNTAMNQVYDQTLDHEPDIYYFNFNGKTGKVVLDPHKNVIPLPEQNFKITPPDFTSANPTWEFIDIDGVKYIFGKTSNEREVSIYTDHVQYNGTVPPGAYTPIDITYSGISSWYLSEINLPFQNESITFSYQSGNNVYYEYYSQFVSTIINNWGAGLDNSLFDHITKITVNSPKYLSQVSTVLGKAIFTYANDRQDLVNALRLSQVQITDYNNSEVKKYSVNNNFYFTSDYCGTTSTDCSRLKLDNVTETTKGTNHLLRSFQYNSTNLPTRKSIQYDHWGYYNTHLWANAIPSSRYYRQYPDYQNHPDQYNLISFPGADKSPDPARSQANILTQVKNVAGGTQTISYQLNEYDVNGVIATTGGLRVNQITEDDGTGVNGIITRTYQYRKSTLPSQSSGRVYRQQVYDYLGGIAEECGLTCPSITFATRFSSSLLDLFDVGGLHVGYDEAQIVYSNGGKENLFFTNYGDHPDDPAQFSVPNNLGILNDDASAYTDPDGPPFIGRGDRSYERGLLVDHIYYGANGKKLKRIQNSYDFYLASSLFAPAGKVMLTAYDGYGGAWGRRGQYQYAHRGVRLKDTYEYVYDQVDESKFITNHTSYSYNSTFSNLVQSKSSFLTDGTEIKQEFKYPYDYNNTLTLAADGDADGIIQFTYRHVINQPIETITWLKKQGWTSYQVIGATLKTFLQDLSSPTHITNPHADYQLKVTGPIADFTPSYTTVTGNNSFRSFSKDSRYKLVHSYDSYDANNGNLLQETPISGLTNSYTWGYNNNLVTSVTSSPSNGPIASTFSHLPMIGLSSIKDPSQRFTYYNFDVMNRLKTIVDHDSNILSRYRYGYKNINEFAGIDFSVSGNRITGQSMTFGSLIDSETAGVTTYVWDFGDGTVIQNGSKTVSHTYTYSGNFTVKFSKINADYGSLNTSKSVIILPAPTASLTSSSNSVNLCSTDGTITLTASASGGCGGFTYKWYTGGVYAATTSTPTLLTGGTVGTYSYQCVTVDSCGNQASSNTVSVTYFKNPSNCSMQ